MVWYKVSSSKRPMKLSQKAEYALRAMLELSRQHGKSQPTCAADIARHQKIPEKFLEVILIELRRAGLLASTRGTDGGYRLAREPRKISVGEICRVIDGVPVIRDQAKPEDTFAFVWKMVDDAVSEIVDHVTLDDVRQRSESKHGVPDFSI